MSDNKKVAFRISPDLHKALRIRAAEEDTNVSALVTRLLWMGLESWPAPTEAEKVVED